MADERLASAAPLASSLASAPSLLSRHCEFVDRAALPRADDEEEAEDDPWVFAEPNESVESFVAAYPPSSTQKAWISTAHEAREQLIREYYAAAWGDEAQSDKAQISVAWEKLEKKTLESLTALLKDAKYGCGKWMVFSPPAEIDALWARVVKALWDGKLGHSAKVSGAGADPSKSHVICVYVDPFWEVQEVERVLIALRSECGVTDSIKFKADGVTLLNLYKDNDYGIPPSFYAAAAGSHSLTIQSTDSRRWCKNGANCKHLKAGRCTYLHREEGGKESKPKEEPSWRVADADGMMSQRRPAGRSGRAPPPAAPPPAAAKPTRSLGGFAALAGFDDGDSEAILEKQRLKAERKAAKKAEEEAKQYAAAAASFEALKASTGGGNWGDEEEEEELVPVAPPEEESESEEEEEAEEAAAEVASAAQTASEPAKDRRGKKKEKKEDEEVAAVDQLLAQLEAGTDEKDTGEGGMSKAAAKRAKKKAEEEARKKEAASKEATEAARSEENAAPEDGENGAPKSAEEIRELMKARAEAAKKKMESKKAPPSAAALAAAEAKKREAEGKKKKDKKTYQMGGGKQVGAKARGSDNKYQGE
ncbi:hypothetical protein AB1Y20_016728 [Prymnesium parvum]|uniref:C3H1-type domain-containing protein n=1 Tax=Prymnesium parvum TaxID=97485 RepID=A0AB34IBW6_PRYPA